ncbi:MAG: AAA family ATPase [Planctomycetaceae bacterium]
MTRWEETLAAMRAGLRRRIVGMDEVIEKILICVFTGNHALLVGVPGLAKTLLVSSIADLMALSFARIQFTPDLMPSDITGTEVLAGDGEGCSRMFRFLPGPIFANIILADEINRTPPKTQAALMEAMEERQVTSVGKRYPLPDPFFVLATQNPIDMEGTYPLPAAQLDRFMFRVRIEYPEAGAEGAIARRVARVRPQPLEAVVGGSDVVRFGEDLAKVEIPEPLQQSIVTFVRATRPTEPDAPDFVRDWIAFGAGPRAAQALVIGARARALLRGRTAATGDDVVAILPEVVRHRLVLSYHATAEGIRAVEVVRRLSDLHFPGSRPPPPARPSLLRRLFGLPGTAPKSPKALERKGS